MDVFLMIRRKKQTIFTDCKDSMTVLELKKILQGILKTDTADMQLLREGQTMDENSTLENYGLNPNTAKAQSPASITLIVRTSPDGAFESPEITPYSAPPDLPEVMKNQDVNAQEGTA